MGWIGDGAEGSSVFPAITVLGCSWLSILDVADLEMGRVGDDRTEGGLDECGKVGSRRGLDGDEGGLLLGWCWLMVAQVPVVSKTASWFSLVVSGCVLELRCLRSPCFWCCLPWAS